MPPPLPDQDQFILDEVNHIFISDGAAANGDEHDEHNEPLDTILHVADEDDEQVGYVAAEPDGPVNYLASDPIVGLPSDPVEDLALNNQESDAPTTARKRGRPSVSQPLSHNGTPSRPSKTRRTDRRSMAAKAPFGPVVSAKKRKADGSTGRELPTKKPRVGKPLKAERTPERIQSRRGAAEAARATFSTALKKAKIMASADPAPKRRGRKPKATEAAAVTSSEAYEVEDVLDSSVDSHTKQMMYLIKWKGYSSDENTWEPKKNLSGASELIKKFKAKNKSEKSVAKKRGRKPSAMAAPTKKRPGRKPGASKPGRKPGFAKAASTARADASPPKKPARRPRAAHGN